MGMDLKALKSVHLTGVGGINMSAVAKLLLAAGVKVSGSDLAENEQTRSLAARGAKIAIGESPDNIPSDAELLICTSAASAANAERMAAAARNIPEMTNFAFLGAWFGDAKTVVVAGTHGKSTTTAMLGLMLEKANLDPTVVVGGVVPAFPDGNARIGRKDLFVVEGDEYARHFLEFHPFGLVLNNIELDHTDVFRDIDALLQSFHELTGQVKDGGLIVANASDDRIRRLIETERDSLAARKIRVIQFGSGPMPSGADDAPWSVTSEQQDDMRVATIARGNVTVRFNLAVPGHFNAMNAAAAFLMADAFGVAYPDAGGVLERFNGIWRRFEFLGESGGARVYSDYGHHPTAAAETLKAARESFPRRRALLCFQPHHRNRTKALFAEFVPSFDGADALVLCEIFEVAGRDEDTDKDVSSRQLVEAVLRRDAERGIRRAVEYEPTPASAVDRTLALAKPDDIVIVMGAGDIDAAIRRRLAI